MSSIVLLMVLSAALLHATWNALVKSSHDPEFTIAGYKLVGSLVCLILVPFFPLPDPASWLAIVLSVIVHNLYYFTLAKAYRVGDLSQVYPLFRGLSPVLVAIGAYFLASESLEPLTIAGLVLITFGLVSLTLRSDKVGKLPRGALKWGMITSLCIAGYTLIDGLGVRLSGNQISYILWLFVLEIVPIGSWLLITRQREWGSYLSQSIPNLCFGGIASGLAYGLVIYAMSLGAMALVSSLRETSVIFAAIIGTLFLKEPFGKHRIIAAVLVATGAILMRAG